MYFRYHKSTSSIKLAMAKKGKKEGSTKSEMSKTKGTFLVK